MESVVLSASIAALVSLVITKALADRIFKIVDDYVNDMCSLTKDFARSVECEIRERRRTDGRENDKA